MTAWRGISTPYWARAGGLGVERSVEKEGSLPGVFWDLSLEAQMGIG